MVSKNDAGSIDRGLEYILRQNGLKTSIIYDGSLMYIPILSGVIRFVPELHSYKWLLCIPF